VARGPTHPRGVTLTNFLPSTTRAALIPIGTPSGAGTNFSSLDHPLRANTHGYAVGAAETHDVPASDFSWRGRFVQQGQAAQATHGSRDFLKENPSHPSWVATFALWTPEKQLGPGWR